MKNPYEYQLPENLIYCDYLEHLLMHIMIFEDYMKDSSIAVNGELLGYGGIVNFIVPELND